MRDRTTTSPRVDECRSTWFRTLVRLRRLALGPVACGLALLGVPPAVAAVSASDARVELFVDGTGWASVSLLLPEAPGDEAGVANALSRAVNCELTGVETREDDDGWWLTGHCASLLPRQGLAVDATICPGALEATLRGEGIAVLTLEVNHPEAGFTFHPDWQGAQEDQERRHYLVWWASVAEGLPAKLPVLFGPTPAELVLRCGVPLLLLVLPPAVTLWLRRRALGSGVSDPAVVWFRFIRSFNLLVLATWLGWVAALWLLDSPRLMGFLLWPGIAGRVTWVTVALYFALPGLMHVLLSQLAYPVLRGLRGMEISRVELLGQVMWTYAALILPLLLAVAGLDAWTRGWLRAAVGLWGGAGVVFLLASRRRMRALRLEPHALTEGELRDRIFALAARAGVSLKQIYLLPALKVRLANALAAVGNIVLLTDYLLENLSRREVDAVVAHELAHLKRRHPLLLVVVAAALIMVPMMWGPAWRGVAVPLGPLLAILVVLLASRRFERSADVLAARLTGDPEALITALVKLASLNLLPVHWGKLDEALLTHPSARRRAEALARATGVPTNRVDELLSGSSLAHDRYPLPATARSEGPVFSTTFKRDVAVLNTWAHIFAATLVPAVAAWLSRQWAGAPWLWYAGGATVALALSLVLANVLPPVGQRRLRPRLAALLAGEGFRDTVSAGVMVGLAPSDTPRVYENNVTWDMGFLVLDDTRLGYIGERVRLALTRGQITDVRRGPSHPGWWSTAGVLVEWRDPASSRAGAFQLRPAAVTSLTQLHRQASALLARVSQWRRAAMPEASPLAELDALGPPALGEVTSLAPRQAMQPVGCLLLASVVVLLASGLSVVLGLGVWGGLYVFATAALALALLFVPTLAHRERPGPR